MRAGLISADRSILRIAVPAIVTNITTPLLGLVDIAVVGHMRNADPAVAIGAIAVGASVFNMLYWLFNFLRMGSSGLTAQAVGRADTPARDLVLWRSLAIALIASILILALSPFLGPLLIQFMDADSSVSEMACRYFAIAVAGAPAVLGVYAMSGWLLGCQDSAGAMWIALTTNVLNILMSLSLVLLLGMGIEGVAIGTATAQWGGLCAGAMLIRRHRPGMPPMSVIFRKGGLRPLLKVNSDIFLRTACLVAVTMWFTRAGASAGALILAANALLMQFFMLFSYFMDGFAFAGEALGGKLYGAGDMAGLHAIVRRLLSWGLALALAAAALYFLAGEWILNLLTKDSAVCHTASDYLPWAVTIPLVGFPAFVYDGIFIGMTRTRRMLAAMAVAMTAFFIIFFLLHDDMGNHALWLAFCSYLAIRGIAQHMMMHR